MLLIMLPGSYDSDEPMARIISIGPDGMAGTLDDLSGEVSLDGTLGKLRTPQERVPPDR